MLEANALAERDVPDYVEVDHAKMTAKLTRVPGLAEVPYPRNGAESGHRVLFALTSSLAREPSPRAAMAGRLETRLS